MQVISLLSLIESGEDEESILEYLSDFETSKNPDVENFLHQKALDNEKRSFTRTSLVVDEENEYAIVGYFTLMIKSFDLLDDVTRTTRGKLTGNRDASVFNSILIAQLGRNDSYKGIVSGSVILQEALSICTTIYNLVGLKIICVEYDEHLDEFYKKNKFNQLQMNENGKILAYVKLN